MEERFARLERYNFWNGNVIDLGFLRHNYTDRVLDYSNNNLVKVLTGQRRTGKSYVMRQLIHRIIESGVDPNSILYINKEFTDFDFIESYTDLEDLVNEYRNRMSPDGKVWLFIDEIQNITGWEHFVNSYSQDFTRQYEIYISGSNSKMLSSELSTELSGRYVEFEILPFSFKESVGITKSEANRQSYISYMEGGALPELFILPNEETRRNYVSSVMSTILFRDIVKRYSLKDARLLEDIFVYLVNNASTMVSVQNIVNYFKSAGRKVTFETVALYIGYIEATFLIHKAERYDIRGKDTISGNCKYYLNDLSYKNYVYPGFAYGVGYKLENLVYLALRRAGYKVYVGVMRNKEVDFVALRGDKRLYVQAAYSVADEQTARREYASLEAITDNYKKLVISLDDFTLPSNNGILHIHAWELEQYLGL